MRIDCKRTSYVHSARRIGYVRVARTRGYDIVVYRIAEVYGLEHGQFHYGTRRVYDELCVQQVAAEIGVVYSYGYGVAFRVDFGGLILLTVVSDYEFEFAVVGDDAFHDSFARFVEAGRKSYALRGVAVGNDELAVIAYREIVREGYVLRKVALGDIYLRGLVRLVEVVRIFGLEHYRHGMTAHAVLRNVGDQSEFAVYFFAGRGEDDFTAGKSHVFGFRTESYNAVDVRQRRYFGIGFRDIEYGCRRTLVIVAFKRYPHVVNACVHGSFGNEVVFACAVRFVLVNGFGNARGKRHVERNGFGSIYPVVFFRHHERRARLRNNHFELVVRMRISVLVESNFHRINAGVHGRRARFLPVHHVHDFVRDLRMSVFNAAYYYLIIIRSDRHASGSGIIYLTESRERFFLVEVGDYRESSVEYACEVIVVDGCFEDIRADARRNGSHRSVVGIIIFHLNVESVILDALHFAGAIGREWLRHTVVHYFVILFVGKGNFGFFDDEHDVYASCVIAHAFRNIYGDGVGARVTAHFVGVNYFDGKLRALVFGIGHVNRYFLILDGTVVNVRKSGYLYRVGNVFLIDSEEIFRKIRMIIFIVFGDNLVASRRNETHYGIIRGIRTHG